MFDTIIRNGIIVDGFKRPRFRADIGLKAERIEAVGDLSSAPANRSLDAANKVVAPGFIDVHNHSDGHLLTTPQLLPKTRQGFATEVLMADGISYAPVDQETAPQWIYYLRALNALEPADYQGWSTIGQYLDRIAAATVQNVAAHVPYANIRTLACGYGYRPVDDYQRRQIHAEIQLGMDEGAVGLSTGLDYLSQCFATTEELIDACRAIVPYDGLYVTHIRYKLGLLPALEEAVEIARRAGVRLHISHLKGTSPQQVEQVLEFLERAQAQVDLSFDVYPYLAGSTMLHYLLPYEVWEDGPLAVVEKLKDAGLRRRFARGLRAARLDLERITLAWVAKPRANLRCGSSLAEVVEASGRAAEDALCDLLIEQDLAVLMVMHEGEDRLVHPFLQHDKFMLGTDGIWLADSHVHPRVYGSIGRLLGDCVRQHRLFSLEEAVYKASGYAAQRFQLDQRGAIRPGYYADLVIFDPAVIADRASYQEPHHHTVGVDYLLVNGTVVIDGGCPLEQLGEAAPGRRLRKLVGHSTDIR